MVGKLGLKSNSYVGPSAADARSMSGTADLQNRSQFFFCISRTGMLTPWVGVAAGSSMIGTSSESQHRDLIAPFAFGASHAV